MAGATDLLAEVVAHGIVAANVVQLVIRRLPVDAPAERVSWRIAALVLPIVLPPLFLVVAPFRREEWFGDLAVFWTPRWERLAVAGVNLRDAGLGLLAVMGLALLVPDLRRLAVGWWRARRDEAQRIAADHPEAADLRAEISALASRLGMGAPALVLVESRRAVLHCRGTRTPAIVATRAVMERLPRPELQAAIAHELVHVRRHDVLRGWVLLAMRVLQWFNPIAQIVARRALQETEWEADRAAAQITGRPLSVARALIRSIRGRDTEFLGLLGRSRIASVEERCRRLMAIDRNGPAGLAGSRFELAIVLAGLSILLFFVV